MILDKHKNAKFRINLMKLHKKKNLKIFKHLGMENTLDLKISFPVGKGCSGKAFERQRTIIGDTSIVSPSQWGLTKAQEELTKNIMTVLSIPLIFQNKSIGVLNIDSESPLQNLEFHQPAFVKELEKKGNEIADFVGYYYLK